MLGLSDRGAIRRLFGEMLKGDAGAVLAAVRGQYDLGVEPAAMLHGLLETCHGVTRAKVAGTEDPALSVEEREAYAEWASRLGFATLHRLWQLLLKGHGEVQSAAMPIEAAEMALLRVVHASQLPDPGELARRLAAGELDMAGSATAGAPSAPSPAAAPVSRLAEPMSAPAPAPVPDETSALSELPATAEAIHALVLRENALLAQLFYDYASVVTLKGPNLLIARHARLPSGFAADLAGLLSRCTGQRWEVALTGDAGSPSLRESELAAEDAVKEAILNSNLYKAAKQAFPDAELMSYSAPEKRSLAS